MRDVLTQHDSGPFTRHYRELSKELRGAHGADASPVHARGAATGKTDITQKQEKVLIRWCTAYLHGLSTDAFYAFCNSEYWENYYQYIDKNKSNFQYHQTDKDGDLIMKTVPYSDEHENGNALGTDLEDYFKQSVKTIVMFYFDNARHFRVVSAMIAMSKRTESNKDKVAAARSEFGYISKNMQPHPKQPVSSLQLHVYTFVSRLLHLYGFVQSQKDYSNRALDEDFFYNSYLKNHPDVLAYCLMDPVLNMCLFMYKYTVLDTQLGSLFVLICLVSITEQSNVENVLSNNVEALEMLRDGVFTNILNEYYVLLFEKTGTVPTSKSKDIPRTAKIFVHCYQLFVLHLHKMYTSCLQNQKYFDGVSIQYSEDAHNSYESVILNIQRVIGTEAASLELRFV